MLDHVGPVNELFTWSVELLATSWSHFPGGRAMAPQQGMALGIFLRYCSQLEELRLEGHWAVAAVVDLSLAISRHWMRWIPIGFPLDSQVMPSYAQLRAWKACCRALESIVCS